ncbi:MULTISPECIES: metallophosphoesterase [unclassified Amycolatopsis]|uniref:metallophosphoesterase n=1 Tax=unclassified Amycolatopsis TaxID=2618356 RepID=UPI0028758578|nr:MULTISPECIES: metallophosphoesterase [unclassified Amycolatopsis]MDS0137799.1 metallophosphoesterase [Amycolatopsis sp. 505]MDS0144288.1 metallophosphoesterase [Amycolatopsis sp. CM201R]
MIIAHLSDLHLDGGSRAEARVAAAMAYLGQLPVDAVVVTGDIADHGTAEEYARAAELLKHPAPVLLCPGNHDVRAAFRTSLLDVPASDGPIDLAQEIGGVLFALCDSTIPGRGAGFLADETLDWLDGVLSGGDGPAFVAFHHPPVEVGVPLVDAIRQDGSERLASVLERHPRVVALLAGHVHTGASTTFAGVPLRIAPGVVSGSLLPIEPGGDSGWTDGGPLEYDRPPALLLHVLHDDGRVTSHHRVVPL